MAIVRPFKAIRPASDKAESVTSLPYDVMNREEASSMAEGNPYSFLHVCRSEIDLPASVDPYDKQVYEKARDNIDKFLEEGVLIEEPKPAYYVYRQTMNGNVQTGIVACVSVDDYENEVIKKHEVTRVEKEIDRINHFDICNANTEPVFLTYRDDETINSVMDKVMKKTAPLYDFVKDDGVGHALWIADDTEDINRIEQAFADVPCLYIADGHHRSASAYKVSKKRREENPGYTGDEEFNFFMAVIFPESTLKVFDYNRVVKDLAGRDVDEFVKAVAEAGFEIEQMGETPYRPEKTHEFSMYLEGKWYKLTANEKIIPGDVIGSLDVSILQDNILKPLLGIDDPRTNDRIDFIGGIRGLDGLKKRADSDMKVAFAVYPVSIAELMAVADSGKIMPPKSTWFEPKLGSGLFMHRL